SAYVVGSVHFIGEGDAAVDHEGFDVWEGDGDADEIWRRYFEQIAAAARSGLFDVLAHPDLVKGWGRDRPWPARGPPPGRRPGAGPGRCPPAPCAPSTSRRWRQSPRAGSPSRSQPRDSAS